MTRGTPSAGLQVLALLLMGIVPNVVVLAAVVLTLLGVVPVWLTVVVVMAWLAYVTVRPIVAPRFRGDRPITLSIALQPFGVALLAAAYAVIWLTVPLGGDWWRVSLVFAAQGALVLAIAFGAWVSAVPRHLRALRGPWPVPTQESPPTER